MDDLFKYLSDTREILPDEVQEILDESKQRLAQEEARLQADSSPAGELARKDRLVTYKGIANYLGVGESTVRTWAKYRNLELSYIGGLVCISRIDLDRWVEEVWKKGFRKRRIHGQKMRSA